MAASANTKNNIIVILLLLFNAPLYAQLSGRQHQEKYRLVWADEFNRNGPPDSANWRFENGFVRNHELQWYQHQNAYCSNGLLIMEARRQNMPNPAYQPGLQTWQNRAKIACTSASINTSGLHSWQYGRFEMRARIAISAGLWPAFWTLGVKGEWPSNGEIDIMEYYRNQLLANIACGTSRRYQAQWFSTKKPIDSFNDPNWANKFHIWRMDWDQQGISLYVDNLLLNHVDLSSLNNKDAAGINPFKQAHYILLNLAIGGDNGGNPIDTPFPKRFEIDYVRVYQ